MPYCSWCVKDVEATTGQSGPQSILIFSLPVWSYRPSVVGLREGRGQWWFGEATQTSPGNYPGS